VTATGTPDIAPYGVRDAGVEIHILDTGHFALAAAVDERRR
jgi:hypothetical protein